MRVGVTALQLNFSMLVLAGCGLGVLQIAFGVLLGRWLRRRPYSEGDHRIDFSQAERLARDLATITGGLKTAIAAHHEQLAAADERLSSEATGDGGPVTDLVAGVVRELVSANRTLAAELADARAELARQEEAIEQASRESHLDPLTQLPNRRALDKELAHRFERYRDHSEEFSVLMIDIDHFKKVNDTHGHAVGDEVLIAVGQTIRRALRTGDFVARQGGEEFVAVLPATALNHAPTAADKVLSAVRAISQFSPLGLQPRVSIGVATIGGFESSAGLVARADAALYLAKQNGRDQRQVAGGEVLVPAAAQKSDKLASACTDLKLAAERLLGQ